MSCQHPQATKGEWHPKPREQKTIPLKPRDWARGRGSRGPGEKDGSPRRALAGGAGDGDERGQDPPHQRGSGRSPPRTQPRGGEGHTAPQNQTGRGGFPAAGGGGDGPGSGAALTYGPGPRRREVLPGGRRKCPRCRGDGARPPWRCRAGWRGCGLPARQRWCRTVTAVARRDRPPPPPSPRLPDVFWGDPAASGRGRGAPGDGPATRDRAPAKDTGPSTRRHGPRQRDGVVQPGIGVLPFTLTACLASREAEDPLPVRGWEGNGRRV